MTKYEVYRQDSNEERKGKGEWTVADMLENYSNKSWTDKRLIGSFDTEEEARRLFEEEKKTCSSYYEKVFCGEVIFYDYVSLEKTEYDESGEYEQGDLIEEFVADIV